MFDADFALAAILFLVGFMVTYLLVRPWMKIASKFSLVGRDMNKHSRPEIPEAGGIAFIIGLCFALLGLVFIKTFVFAESSNVIFTFAIITTLLLSGFIGFIDDVLGWKVGLRQKHKFLLTIPMALPLMVVNSGHSVMKIPLIGGVDFGLFYPLLIVPVGIVGAANGFNLLAGFNGLEAGMGAIILSALGYVAWARGLYWVSLVAVMVVASLLAFLAFNKYPSKIFPGDSLTYTTGAMIAAVAILGNMEKMAIALFAPYIIEFILKLRSGLKAECFGTPDEKNMLSPPGGKCCSLTHVVMKYSPKIFGRKIREYEAVMVFYAAEIILAFFAVSVF